MAVKFQAPDGSGSGNRQPSESQPTESQLSAAQSLQRGTRLLATLVQAARAARLEAEVAELEAALAEAREGASRRLERCLARFDAAGDGELPHVAPADAWQAVPAPSATMPAATADPLMPMTLELDGSLRSGSSLPVASQALDARGWAPYLVHARRRLQEREGARPQALMGWDFSVPAGLLQQAASQPDIEHETFRRADKFAAVPQRGDADRVGEGAARSELAAARVTGENQIGADQATHGIDDIDNFVETDGIDGVADIDSVEELEPCAGAIDGAPADELDLSSMKNLSRELEQGPAVTRPMLSGVSLSLVGHIGLLTCLFLITLKQTDESASLGSQLVSAVAPLEEVELTPQFEALEPIEMQLDEALEPTIDPSQIAPSESTALAEIQAAAASASPLLSASSDAAGSSRSAGAILSETIDKQGARRADGRGHAAPAMSSTGGKFFGAGAGGNFFCYVVDSSGSMRGAAWESAKAELVRSIGTLTENQRFYIVFFAKEVAALPEPGGREPAAHGLAATKENIEHARRWIETVKLDRGGPPNDALELAIAREPDAIYLLTDGVTQVDVCGFLRKRNRTSDIISGELVRVPIHAIAYHSLDGQQLLRRLAQENDGQFHYVPAPKY